MSEALDKYVGGSGSTILIVDDDDRLLRAYALQLSRWFRVVTASNVAEARAVASREQPLLAIVDVLLGGESGIDLVRELKANRPELRVAMISATATLDLAVLAARSGADAVLSKPATVTQILRRLDAELPPGLDRLKPATLDQVGYEHITRVVADCDGNLKRAARELGISRSTLHRKLKRPAAED
jgi:two-component system response regulator RegA